MPPSSDGSLAYRHRRLRVRKHRPKQFQYMARGGAAGLPCKLYRWSGWSAAEILWEHSVRDMTMRLIPDDSRQGPVLSCLLFSGQHITPMAWICTGRDLHQLF